MWFTALKYCVEYAWSAAEREMEWRDSITQYFVTTNLANPEFSPFMGGLLP